MTKFLIGAAAVAIVAATPASAQILGGGIGGTVGGTVGGLTGGVRGTLDTSIDRTRPVRTPRTARSRLGEREIVRRTAADARIAVDRSRTRGAAAASRRGLVATTPTTSGVQVFVPSVSIAAPSAPVVVSRSYPAYGGYYYSPGAVFVENTHVDHYMYAQQQDLEQGLAGTGATVERRGNDLIVALPADVTFAFDKSDIRPRFYGALNAFARTMNAYPGSDVEVIGHTDSVGSDAYNLGLSQRRGGSVADYLAARGVEPTRMVVEAMGESQPIATNATVEGRAANRRVELIIHPRAG